MTTKKPTDKTERFTMKDTNPPPYKVPHQCAHLAEQARRYNRPEDSNGELLRPVLNDKIKNRAAGLTSRRHRNPPDMLNPHSKKYNPTKYYQENPRKDS